MMSTLANQTMKLVLRSPLHGLVSSRVMLLSVSGRKSGRLYTTPVNYVREGAVITVISRRDRTWWRNLSGGAPVAMRVKGKNLSGIAEVLADEGDKEAIAAALLAMHPRWSPERAALRSQDRVMVRIQVGDV